MSAYKDLDVAVVDDDPLFLEYVTGLLRVEGGIRARSFGSGEHLITHLRAKAADCIVLDYDLGNDNGLSIAELIRSHVPDCPPIVMLTGGGNEKTAVKAFRNGFSDYVSKRGFNIRELLDAIGRAVTDAKLNEKTAAEAVTLHQRLDIDPTTSLYTKEFMSLRLSATIAEKNGFRFAIGIISLEELSAFQIDVGYQTVQRLLAQYAASLRRLLNRDDVVGHLTPDTFLLIEDAGSGETPLGYRLRSIARELSKPVTIEAARIQINPRVASVSFPKDGRTAAELIASAIRLAGGSEVEGASRTPTSETADVSSPAADASPTTPLAPSHTKTIVHFEERRSERRIRALRQGKIIHKNGQTVFDCTIRDISPRGARLRLDTYFAVPGEFGLEIVGSGAVRRAVSRWQIGREVGLEFLA